jgi:hypothetical protein
MFPSDRRLLNHLQVRMLTEERKRVPPRNGFLALQLLLTTE